MKTCKKCNKLKDTCEFHAHKHTKDGINSWCISCVKESSRLYYEANRDKVNARAKQWQKDNAEKARAKSNAWKAKNRDQARQAEKEYRQTFNGKAVNLTRSAKKRSIEFGWSFDLDKDFVIDLLTTTPVCPLLGIQLNLNSGIGIQPDSPSLDRIDSTKGYTKDNVKIISWRANQIKSNSTLEEFLTIAQNLPGYYKA